MLSEITERERQKLCFNIWNFKIKTGKNNKKKQTDKYRE